MMHRSEVSYPVLLGVCVGGSTLPTHSYSTRSLAPLASSSILMSDGSTRPVLPWQPQSGRAKSSSFGCATSLQPTLLRGRRDSLCLSQAPLAILSLPPFLCGLHITKLCTCSTQARANHKACGSKGGRMPHCQSKLGDLMSPLRAAFREVGVRAQQEYSPLANHPSLGYVWFIGHGSTALKGWTGRLSIPCLGYSHAEAVGSRAQSSHNCP